MKVAAIAIIIGLSILPFVVRLLLVIIKLLTDGREATFRIFSKTSNPASHKIKRKLVYILGAIYGLLLFVAMVWALFILTSDLNVSTKIKIITGVFSFLLFSIEAIVMYYWYRHINKIHPRPKAGSEVKTVIEWENKYWDLYSKKFGQMFLVIIALFIFLCAIFALTIYLLKL